MNQLAQFRELLYSKYRPTSYRVWSITIFVGLLFALASTFISQDQTLLSANTKNILSLISQILAEAFIVSGVVGIIFGNITQKERFTVTEIATTKVLHEILTPIRTEILLHAYEFYEWDSKFIQIFQDDENSYLNQETNIHFTMHAVPHQLLIVAVSESSLLQRYMMDDRCLLRWEVSKEFSDDMNEALKPLDVIVNGKIARPLKSKTIKVGDDTIVEHKFTVPKECLLSEYANVRFGFSLLRPLFGKKDYVTPTMYRPSLRSNFKMTFQPEIQPTEVLVHDTGILPLSGIGGVNVETSRSNYNSKIKGLIVDIPFPTQRRSQLVFEIIND